MAENLLPSAMVPGLVTIKDKDGKTQNVFPIDAKELLRSGDYELVDNGALEAARMNANPLRSGRSAASPEMTVVEVTGREGRVIASSDPKEVDRLREAGDSADARADPSLAAAEEKPTPAKAAPAKAEEKPAPAKS